MESKHEEQSVLPFHDRSDGFTGARCWRACSATILEALIAGSVAAVKRRYPDTRDA